ncbi:hypothetical protein AAMO2058_001364600 [Amorphochlora amoebiformis]|uniref:Uncharacterized protein n=1 Tax=Amorphochlora amoebiformis TaxID=1561963 RepID=A0A7S0GRQ9_9EUKA|mmetsp:Transcript_18147/g.28910  ORF Transcript_18147/g.28910 Transcript_18147/m.28910 type:complete len:160 (+) Transcript_18147:158-637(+)
MADADNSKADALVLSTYKVFHILKLLSDNAIENVNPEARSQLLGELKAAQGELRARTEAQEKVNTSAPEVSMATSELIARRDALLQEIKVTNKKLNKTAERMHELRAILRVATAKCDRDGNLSQPLRIQSLSVDLNATTGSTVDQKRPAVTVDTRFNIH